MTNKKRKLNSSFESLVILNLPLFFNKVKVFTVGFGNGQGGIKA